VVEIKRTLPDRFRPEWESYERGVMPADASEAQRIETRRAFYAGAQAAFAMVRSLPNDETAAVECLVGFQLELAQFAADVESGKA
jgi:hypothetical protein